MAAVMTSAAGLELGTIPRSILFKTTAAVSPGAKIQPIRATHLHAWERLCALRSLWPKDWILLARTNCSSS